MELSELRYSQRRHHRTRGRVSGDAAVTLVAPHRAGAVPACTRNWKGIETPQLVVFQLSVTFTFELPALRRRFQYSQRLTRFSAASSRVTSRKLAGSTWKYSAMN